MSAKEVTVSVPTGGMVERLADEHAKALDELHDVPTVEINLHKQRTHDFFRVNGHEFKAPLTRLSIEVNARGLPSVLMEFTVLRASSNRRTEEVTFRGRLVTDDVAQEFELWLRQHRDEIRDALRGEPVGTSGTRAFRIERPEGK